MSDDVKQESVETPADSQSVEQTPENTNEVTAQEASQPQTPKIKAEEQAEWESLSGHTQERVKTLLERAKKAEEQTARLAQVQNDYQAVSQTQPDYSQDQIRDAAIKLRQAGGLASIEDLNLVLDQVRRDQEHARLEGKYDGS